MFSLESPHRGDSNECTQYTIVNMNKKNTLYYLKSAAMCFFFKGLKNEFETAVVNEPSVFEPPRFYCTSFVTKLHDMSIRSNQIKNCNTLNIYGIKFSRFNENDILTYFNFGGQDVLWLQIVKKICWKFVIFFFNISIKLYIVLSIRIALKGCHNVHFHRWLRIYLKYSSGPPLFSEPRLSSAYNIGGLIFSPILP